MTNTSEIGTPVSDQALAGAREWAGLAVLTLPCLVVAMNAHVLLLAVPQLSADLQPTGSQLLWIMDSYAFLVAGCLIPAGALGDRLGRRRLLLMGAAGFAGASVVAALAPTALALIVARGIQGAAGATLMPSTLALIRQLFTDERRRTVALGVWTASFALGGVVGPLLAGGLLSRFWWGSVFLVGVPVMLLLLVLGPVLLPEASVTTRGRVDGTGTALALITVLAAVYALKAGASEGVGLRPAAAAAVALIAAVSFIRQQRHTPDPLVDPALLRRRRFSLPVTINAGAFFLLYGTQVALTQYLQLVLGLKPLPAALIGIPSALAYLAGSALGPVAAQRLTAPVLLGVGLAFSIAGFVLLAAADGDTAIPVIVTGTVVASLGLAPVYLLTTQLAITAAPPAQAGTASAVSEAGGGGGGGLGGGGAGGPAGAPSPP